MQFCRKWPMMHKHSLDSELILPLGNVDKPNVRQSTELKGHTAAIEKVAFNPVKELELCSVSSDGTVKFWDVRTRNIINEVKGLGEAFTLAWAPDGESLVVGNKVHSLWVVFLFALPTNLPIGGYALCPITDTKHTSSIPSAKRTNQQHHLLLEWQENLCHHFRWIRKDSTIPQSRACLSLRLQRPKGC
jgi:WD40 repeat protein